MNNEAQRIREPELKEVLMSLESLSNRFDGLTLELKNKIQSIYNPPQLESPNKAMDIKETAKQDDMIGRLNEQIETLKVHGNRLEDLLLKVDKII